MPESETLVRDIQGFSQFLNIVAENSGYFLDFSKLASKTKIHRSAARRYYEILEDTLLCHRLEAFSHKDESVQKKLVKHSKYYLFDVGIKNGILKNFKASQDRIGFLFEHLFFNQVKNMVYSLDTEFPVFHFRTLIGQEVDFVFKINNKNIIVELKTSEPTLEDIRKIENINNEYQLKADIFVTCLKCKAKKIGSAKVLPWQEVLKKLLAP